MYARHLVGCLPTLLESDSAKALGSMMNCAPKWASDGEYRSVLKKARDLFTPVSDRDQIWKTAIRFGNMNRARPIENAPSCVLLGTVVFPVKI